MLRRTFYNIRGKMFAYFTPNTSILLNEFHFVDSPFRSFLTPPYTDVTGTTISHTKDSFLFFGTRSGRDVSPRQTENLTNVYKGKLNLQNTTHTGSGS